MPLDGFTLHFLKQELTEKIIASRIDKIMMPAKDMFVFALRGSSGSHKLLLSASASFARMQLTEQKYENPEQAPVICMLFRKHLQGGRLLAIRQVDCDRILHIDIECLTELGDLVTKTLVIEIMGKHSNIILVNERGLIVDAIKRVSADMSRVRMVLPGLAYQAPPAQDKLNPFTMREADLIARMQGGGKAARFLQEHISGISKPIALELCEHSGYTEASCLSEIDQALFAQALCAFYRSLLQRYAPNLLLDVYGSPLDFFAMRYHQFDESRLRFFDSLSVALDHYFSNRDVKDKIKQKSQYLAKVISNHIHRCENRLQQLYQIMEDDKKAEEYKIYGELINANLYALDANDRGKEWIKLPNFYSESYEPLLIPLNVERSIKENANLYFKKYKKIRKAQELAVEQEAQTQEEIAFLNQLQQDMENSKSSAELDEIKLILAMKGYIKGERKARKTASQSREIRVDIEGVSVLVGKNSIQNERITHAARPDEVWMHVQGIPGSHVVIKSENPSEAQILQAAKLAAYFSSAREQSSVMVDYTQKKHVKKPVQSAVGFMRYKNFKSVLVSLSEEERARFSQL